MGLDGGGGILYPALMSKAKAAENAAAHSEDLPFEEALKRLESIVEAMEAQDLPLETLLARYEEGAKLTPAVPGEIERGGIEIAAVGEEAPKAS